MTGELDWRELAHSESGSATVQITGDAVAASQSQIPLSGTEHEPP